MLATPERHARPPSRPPLVESRPPLVELEAGALENRLAGARGYRVEAEGETGTIVGVPLAGQPPQPLVLVVRNGDCVRFVSVRRVLEVIPDERLVVLRPTTDGLWTRS
jgi:hypothetical protein